MRMGGPPEPVWTTWRKVLPYLDSNSDPAFIQPVAGRYINYTILSSSI
jgi:hypothetical protein